MEHAEKVPRVLSFPRVPRFGLAWNSVRFGLAWNSVRFGEACELNLTHFTNRVG